MGALERVCGVVIAVPIIILSLVAAIVVLTVCASQEWLFRLFPSLDAKYSSPDYVRDQPDA
jgi:hypothetical protein